MSTIANLAVQISANTQALTLGLQTAGSKLMQFTSFASGILDKGLVQTAREMFASLTSTIAQGLGSIPVLGAPLAFVANVIGGLVDSGFGLLDFLRKTWAGMKEMGAQAKGLGINVAELSVLVFAAGAHGEEMVKSLQHMSRELGKAQMGSKEAQGSFYKLKLDWEELASLPVAEQFYRTADAIAQMKSPALQATAAFAIFGRGVAPILHLLKQGSEGLKKFKEQAERRGFVFSEADVEAARQGAKALDQLDKTFVGVKNAFAVAISPIAAVLLQSLNELAARVGGFPQLFKKLADDAAQYLAQFTAAVAEVVPKVEVALERVAKRLDGLLEKVEKFVTFTPPLWLSVAGAPFQSAPATRPVPVPVAPDASFGQKAAGWFTNLADRLSRSTRDLFGNIKLPRPDTEGLDNYVQLWDKASKVWEGIKDPLDKFKTSMDDLDQLLDAQILTWEDYSLAAMKAFQEVAKTEGLGQYKPPAAALEGSKEAYHIIAQDENRGQQDVASILRQLKMIQERQAKAAEDTARALQNVMVQDL
jgi:hypothetical protein